MTHFFHSVYDATWLWLPFLVLFLVQGLHCAPPIKLLLFKIVLYYTLFAIGLHLLLPTTHIALRTILFDITTRVFLFIQAAEMLWHSWNANPSLAVSGGILRQQQLIEDEEDETTPRRTSRQYIARPILLVFYGLSALFYLGWAILGLLFASTLIPGI